MRIRTLRTMLVIASCALIATSHAADPRKVWHGILAEQPPGFDPAGATNTSAAAIVELVFDRLLTYDYLARPAKLVPLAAEALPQVADEGRTWTITLRKGLYFSADPAFKGVRREATAQDVVYSIKRFLDPKQRSPYQFMFRDKFVGLDELARAADKGGRFDYDAAVDGLRAVDRYTVRFTLRAPDYRFPYLLAHSNAAIVAREIVEAYGNDIGAHPVGTGPYVLAASIPGTRYVLEANPLYRNVTWSFEAGSDPRDAGIVAQMRGKTIPQIGRVELSIIEEDTAYWLAFLKGDLDVVNLLPRFQAASLVNGELKPDLKAKGLSMYRMSTPSVGFAAFNFRDPTVGGFTPDKVALRRAIAMAYNGDQLVRIVFNGNGSRAQMPVPPDVYGYDPSYRSSIPYDPDLANRLLDRFGYARGSDGFRRMPDGKPLLLVRNTGAGGSFRELDTIWQTSMQKIGVRMRMDTLSGAEAAKLSTQCRVTMFEWNWAADYPDGENFMQLLYGPNSNQSNAGCYQSAAYDALYRKAEQLQDGPQRARLFVDMTRQAEADTAWVLGAYANRIVVVQPWVLGHKSHPFLYSILPYVDVKPH
jgi:ABC-type transport system substrate-binding protein